jgi:hypothetical protein
LTPSYYPLLNETKRFSSSRTDGNLHREHQFRPRTTGFPCMSAGAVKTDLKTR